MIGFQCRAIRSDTSLSISSSAGLECADTRSLNTAETLESSFPERSRAVMVFAKSGAEGSWVIAAISAEWSAKACSKAGRKCSGAISAKGGVSNGVCQACSSGFAGAWQTPFETPPFAEIAPEHFLPAFEQAFADHTAEITAITYDPTTPDFANT